MLTHLLDAYQTLNEKLFDGQLGKVHFVPNFTLRTIAVAFYPPDTIQIGAAFASSTPEFILDELVHAMVHVFNYSRGVEDFTLPNKYHRSEFCHEALRVGLAVKHHNVRGWGMTTSNLASLDGQEVRFPEHKANTRLRQLYDSIGLPAMVFSRYQGHVKGELAKRRKKEFTFRYHCQCVPPMLVRSGRRPDSDHPFAAVCCYCNAKFVPG